MFYSEVFGADLSVAEKSKVDALAASFKAKGAQASAEYVIEFCKKSWGAVASMSDVALINFVSAFNIMVAAFNAAFPDLLVTKPDLDNRVKAAVKQVADAVSWNQGGATREVKRIEVDPVTGKDIMVMELTTPKPVTVKSESNMVIPALIAGAVAFLALR